MIVLLFIGLKMIEVQIIDAYLVFIGLKMIEVQIIDANTTFMDF